MLLHTCCCIFTNMMFLHDYLAVLVVLRTYTLLQQQL